MAIHSARRQKEPNMRPFLAALVLAPALMLLPAADAQRFDPRPRPAAVDRLEGDYVNTSNDGRCAIHRRGRGFVFVNENGDRATFEYAGPGRLAIVATRNWDPNVVATVSRDRRGRVQVRFDAPRTAPGYWASDD
jgi:hypothetical protein